MPGCSGSGCANAIAWKVTDQGLWMDSPVGVGQESPVVTFSLDSLRANLNLLLGTWGVTPVASSSAPIQSLCGACWAKQAAGWGAAESKPADVYIGARAKTDATGVYLQVQDAAFNANIASKEPAGKPQFEPILSCLVHELMHYWSARHEGVSQHNREQGVEWDEVLCDWLGFLVYQRTARSLTHPGGKFANYIGPYGRNAQFVSQAKSNWKSELNIARISNEFLNKPEKRNQLPRELKQYFTEQAPAAKPPPTGAGLPLPMPGAGPKVNHGDRTADLYEKTLARYCATWFFSGPLTRIEDETDFASFIRKKDVVFQKAGTVFPAFGETATPI